MNIAVIPARGGSKRIPRKNIRNFCGKPIIAWSIEAAQKSGCFESIVVSTEDAEISAIARKWGAEVPFVRPTALANDHATTDAVFSHALRAMEGIAARFKYACCIYPTCPLLDVEDLKSGLRLLHDADYDCVISITPFEFPIQQALVFDAGRVRPLDPQAIETRSQDLKGHYHDAAMFYWVNVARYLSSGRIFGDHTGAIRIPDLRSQDINSEQDWLLAEMKFKMLNEFSAKNSN